jgi:hypothetical protein
MNGEGIGNEGWTFRILRRKVLCFLLCELLFRGLSYHLGHVGPHAILFMFNAYQELTSAISYALSSRSSLYQVHQQKTPKSLKCHHSHTRDHRRSALSRERHAVLIMQRKTSL